MRKVLFYFHTDWKGFRIDESLFYFPSNGSCCFQSQENKTNEKIPKKINQVLEFDCKKKSNGERT